VRKSPASDSLFVGIMSGTSADGVDAVLIRFGSGEPQILNTRYQPFPATLRRRILALQAPAPNELDEAALVGNELARQYAATVRQLLHDASTAPGTVRAIGCHGQTVRHRPDSGYTLQLLNGALLAELTGIAVVCDFRSRDVAAGGQGAPLVPAFHASVFASRHAHRVIANIGGIANITDLPTQGVVRGFDTGPGNVLLDLWSEKHLGTAHDENGNWARSGHVLPDLLQSLQDYGFFGRRPPKSTGRDEFNLPWLESRLNGSEDPKDVQATLVQLTAQTLARAVREHCSGAAEMYVCGGGAHNGTLMQAVRDAARPVKVSTTDALGIDADWVEACAFAWLAMKALNGEPGNLPSVTGAAGPRILGAIYRA
jgi:anhydro-N-acetylmuramic acid kinase